MVRVRSARNQPIRRHRSATKLVALLVDLEIIDIYAERSSATRDDIRDYEAPQLETLETLLTTDKP
mgnify:CR=1 FL=1